MRDVTQAMEALDRANALRMKRAALKRAIHSGDLDVAAVLLDPPWFVQDMRTLDLLDAAPNMGPAKLERLNIVAARERINLLRAVGRQSLRSRAWLVEQLPCYTTARQILARAA